MKSIPFLLTGATLLLSISSGAHADETTLPLSLMDAIREAEKANPGLKSVQYQEQAAGEQVRAARSGYLPELDVAAIAGGGNVGAVALLGIDPNLGASQRIGEGGGLILKQTLWDFGRTGSAVETAKLNKELQSRFFDISQAEVDIQVLRSYLDCAFLKSEAADARFISEQARIIAKETNRFVVSGQRSVVERYLVEQQQAEADRINEALLTKSQLVEKRLAIELGRNENQSVTCGDLYSSQVDFKSIIGRTWNNPVLQAGEVQKRVAQSKLEQVKAEERPSLIGVVNGGYFNNDLLARSWNYSAGAGITFPLFTGFKLQAEVARSSAELGARETDYELTRQNVDDTNNRYDEQIRSTEVALRSLAQEMDLAKKAFDLARKRYFSLQGTMVDLREALRNLNHVTSAMNEARRNYLVNQGSQALFNGVRP